MTNENKATNSDHGNYERRDVGVAGVLYFILGLAFAGLIVHFIVQGVYSVLDKQTESQQAPVSPLVRNAAKDTRHLPPEYKSDYEKYLKTNFPAPQLEIDERTQLNDIRLHEEQTLSTYDWVDKPAGTVHIPIERAMDLIVQRGLPVRTETTTNPTPRKKGQTNSTGNKQ